MPFSFDAPYDRPDYPEQIRYDFAELSGEMDPADLLRRVAGQLPTDTLAEIIDDLMMGRI